MTTDDPADEVAGVIVALRLGDTLTRANIRTVGRIAKTAKMNRRRKEPYDQFLARLLERISK